MMYTDTLIASAEDMLLLHTMTAKEQKGRLSVVREALSWLDTPYHHMGRVKGAGVDCGMFLAEVFERCGLIAHIEQDYYPPDWSLHRSDEKYLAHIEEQCVPVDGSVLPGDIVLHRFGRCVSHGGIFLCGDMMIHAYIQRGVIISSRNESNLKEREYGCYRLSSWEGAL